MRLVFGLVRRRGIDGSLSQGQGCGLPVQHQLRLHDSCRRRLGLLSGHLGESAAYFDQTTPTASRFSGFLPG
jgi:hypothetical protein